MTLGTVAHQAPLSVGLFQARIMEWVAMPSSRGSSQPRDWTQVSCNAGGGLLDSLPAVLPGKLLRPCFKIFCLVDQLPSLFQGEFLLIFIFPLIGPYSLLFIYLFLYALWFFNFFYYFFKILFYFLILQYCIGFAIYRNKWVQFEWLRFALRNFLGLQFSSVA